MSQFPNHLTNMEEENKLSIVLDCGAATCKAGFAGENIPTAVFPSVMAEFNPEVGSCYSLRFKNFTTSQSVALVLHSLESFN